MSKDIITGLCIDLGQKRLKQKIKNGKKTKHTHTLDAHLINPKKLHSKKLIHHN